MALCVWRAGRGEGEAAWKVLWDVIPTDAEVSRLSSMVDSPFLEAEVGGLVKT